MSIPPSFHHDQNVVKSPSHSHTAPASLPLTTFVPPTSALYPSFLGESDLGYLNNTSYSDYSHTDNQNYHGLATLSNQQEVYRSVAVDSDYGASHSSPFNFGDLHAVTNETGDLDAFVSFPSRKELSLNPKYDRAPALDYNVNDVVEHVSEPPQAPGGYLESNCHFFVDASPVLVLKTLHDILRTKGVDCDMRLDHFRMKCEAYRECARTEFCVRVFTATPEQRAHGKYAVEFQRRFGDGMVFHNLYAEIKSELERSASAVKLCASSFSTSSSSKTSVLTCPPLDLPDMRCCQQQQQDVLRSLMSMCQSDCVDVKAQALIALAEMTSKATPEMKKCMIENGVVATFIRSLGCQYSDVHRCAVTGLANLMSCRKNIVTCNNLLQDDTAREALSMLIKTGCPMVVRECARAFAFLVDTKKDLVKDDACVRSCVQALLASEDLQARQFAEHVQATLEPLK